MAVFPQEDSFFFEIIIWAFGAPAGLFILLSLALKRDGIKKFLSQNSITAVSAGLLMSLAFIEFLPHGFENNSSFGFSLTLLLCFVGFLLVETRLIPRLNFMNRIFPDLPDKGETPCSHYHRHHHPFAQKSSFSAIGCLLVCSFFDGMRLGSALMINIQTISTLAVALLGHILPEALVVMGLAQKSGLSLKAQRAIQALFCLFLGQGILIVGLFGLTVSSGVIVTLGAAALIYVSFVHLLPVAFYAENQKWFLISLTVSALGLFFFH